MQNVSVFYKALVRFRVSALQRDHATLSWIESDISRNDSFVRGERHRRD